VGSADPQGVKKLVFGIRQLTKNWRHSEWWTVWKYVCIKPWNTIVGLADPGQMFITQKPTWARVGEPSTLQ